MQRHHANISRFLAQSTLGADQKLIKSVSKSGIVQWLNNELDRPLSELATYQRATEEIWTQFKADLIKKHGESAINGDGNNPALPYKWYFHMAWWQTTLTSDHNLLRQRVALALSEILVISDNSSLELDAVGMASYYDLLYKHAFGNYTDLLYDVSLHPCMGVYLSHMNNQKAQPAATIHPDENYAREIMQLFSIGLYQLNQDGSRKLDSNNQPIATYDNQDIKQLARVFTGITADSYQFEWNNSFWSDEFNGYQVGFDDGIDKTYKTVPFVEMTKPMVVDENYHDQGAKTLLQGHIKIKANQLGKQEIRQVVNKLVSHPNAAPFMARKLINQLVTSNPSAEYVASVASKFGEKGDLKAVIKEILLFPLNNPVGKTRFLSARREKQTQVQSQKLKSPVLRITQLLRALNVDNPSKRLWLTGDDIQHQLNQHPLSSPTVFNFYNAHFTPHGPIEKLGLVAPEFELHNSATSIAYVNLMYYWFFADYLPVVTTEISQQQGILNVPELDIETLQKNSENRLKFDLSSYIEMAKEQEKHDQLIETLSVLLVGQSNIATKGKIKQAFAAYANKPEWVVQTILFMLSISAEFTVLEA
ncbi:DUF1800 family protein [Vibrio sp. 99-8-1]|uniref:DUF1800 domain-containing protein n=1 Tax=Vibrio sp. 99-8-1 TaxID=2607602 RepID=UPI00149341A1|nr:DUF1800 family protein [Vibrio sp. 99-8-1]NOI68624.1 DUF1800 domain-containing protein [Vibrio sp. 99-8-1]